MGGRSCPEDPAEDNPSKDSERLHRLRQSAAQTVRCRLELPEATRRPAGTDRAVERPIQFVGSSCRAVVSFGGGLTAFVAPTSRYTEAALRDGANYPSRRPCGPPQGERGLSPPYLNPLPRGG